MEVRPQERRYGDTGLLMLLDRAGMPLLLCVGAQEIQERDDDLRDIAAYMKQQVVRGGRAEEQSKRKEGGSWPLHAVRRGQGFCRQREAAGPHTAEAWAGREGRRTESGACTSVAYARPLDQAEPYNVRYIIFNVSKDR